MKNILSVILALTLVWCVSVASADDVTYTVLCQPDSEVFVRPSPSKSREPEGYLLLGETIDVSDTRETDSKGREWGFCENLSFEASEGWICMLYLVEGTVATIYDGGASAAIIGSGRVNARRSPQKDADVRKRLEVGTEITVYAECGGWCVTDQGYVMSEYAEIGGEESGQAD